MQSPTSIVRRIGDRFVLVERSLTSRTNPVTSFASDPLLMFRLERISA